MCRRFRALACAPPLLHDINVQARGAKALPTARALQPWLARHAAHVQRLDLSFSGGEDEHSELAGVLSRCVEAGCAAGQLQELELYGHQLGPLPWLPAMGCLARLTLVCWTPCALPPEISGLSRLQSLFVTSPHFHAATRLPPSLTYLGMESSSIEMPPQVRRRHCPQLHACI